MIPQPSNTVLVSKKIAEETCKKALDNIFSIRKNIVNRRISQFQVENNNKVETQSKISKFLFGEKKFLNFKEAGQILEEKNQGCSYEYFQEEILIRKILLCCNQDIYVHMHLNVTDWTNIILISESVVDVDSARE